MEIRSTAFLAIAIAITALTNKYRTKKKPTVVENLDDLVISGGIRVRIPQKLDVPRHQDSKIEKPRHQNFNTKKPQHRVSPAF